MMDAEKAFDKVAALCARQELCTSDIKKKLIRWELTPPDVEKVVARLISEKFIDDARFAGFFVRDKYRFNKWGKDKIRWQLRLKSINDEVINEALASIPDEEYGSTLLQLLRTKDRQLKQDDSYKRKAALMRYAASRGFKADDIANALTHLHLVDDDF